MNHKPSFGSLLLVLSFLLAINTSYAQTTGWKWSAESKGYKAYGYATGTNICTDLKSNIITAGYIDREDSTSFGTLTLHNFFGKNQMFITKTDSAGNYLWVVGTKNTDAQPLDITTDTAGNIYVVGMYYTRNCDIGRINLTNILSVSTHHNPMIFLTKISPSGVVLWAQNIVVGGFDMGTERSLGTAICADKPGNVYIAGTFSRRGESIGSTTLANAGGIDVYIAKFDPSGTNLWATSYGGLGTENAKAGIQVSDNGYLYVAGSYDATNPITIGTTVLADSTNYLAKFDVAGNLVWAKNMYASLTSFDIKIDSSERIYLCGGAMGPCIVGTDTFKNMGAIDAFIARLDTSGKYLWAKFGGGVNLDRAYSVAPDNYGNVWICGTMGMGPGVAYTMDFSGKTVTAPIVPFGKDPAFLVEYDECGHLLETIAIGDGGSQPDITTNDEDQLFITSGHGRDTLILGADILLPPTGNYENMFIADYQYDHTSGIPSFFPLNGHVNMCVGSSSVSIDTVLAVKYGAIGNELTWTMIIPPLHGTAVAAYTAISSGSLMTPSGLTYTPVSGYIGIDSFKVAVSTCNTTAVTIIYATIDTLPAIGKITGPDTVCIGHTASLSNAYSGGVWASKNGHTSVSSSGVVSFSSAGTDTISYTITNACATVDTFMVVHAVSSCSALGMVKSAVIEGIDVYPNPSRGNFIVDIRIDVPQETHMLITNIVGVVVADITTVTNKPVNLQLNVPDGIYFLNASSRGGKWNKKLEIISR